MTADRFYLPSHATWYCVICLICTELHSKIIRYLSAVCHQTHPDLKAELIIWFHCYVCGVSMPPIPNCLAKSVEICTKIHPFHSFPIFSQCIPSPRWSKARCQLTRCCFQSNQTPAQVPGRIFIVSGIFKVRPAPVSTQTTWPWDLE